MGGICGKNAHHKKPVEQAVISIPAQQNQPKPQVYNPYLDKSQGSPQKNQDSNTLKNSNLNPQQSSRKNNPQPIKQEFELNLSPDKNSPQKTEKSKGNIIKESEYITPQVIENPKSNFNAQNDILNQQPLENVPFESEKNVILEAGEFLNEEIFGEDDFVLFEEKNLKNINNNEQKVENLPAMIFAKAILEAPEILENGFNIDLFEEIPTFDNELDEEESLKKSDIQELNSSGIQYKENQYGVSIENRVNRKPIKVSSPVIENFNEEKNSLEKSINMRLDFNQAIIEEKYEDSPDLKASSLNEKPFDLPMENNIDPHFIDPYHNFKEGMMNENSREESPQLENEENFNKERMMDESPELENRDKVNPLYY